MSDGYSLRDGILATLEVSDRPLCVAELAELFEVRFPLMNYHLQVLHRASAIEVAYAEVVEDAVVRTFYECAPAL